MQHVTVMKTLNVKSLLLTFNTFTGLPIDLLIHIKFLDNIEKVSQIVIPHLKTYFVVKGALSGCKLC